ncbi:MAG: metallophosphoesterase [Candidatus Hydrothermarchaeaceae archaeon]
MRFAHIADTHMGIRQYNVDEREEDFYAAFHEAVDKIIENGCDFVIHSGDLFDEPRPQVKAMVKARDAIDRLAGADIPVYTVAGNHDILMRRGAVLPHALYRKLEVLTPQNPVRELEGILICGLPYHSKVHSNALKEKLKELGKKADDYDKSILVLHQGIDKYFGLEYELKIGDVPHGFDYYALGHIHKRIEDDFGGGKLVYPGSTEMWRIDELTDYKKNGKGFVVVDTSDFVPKRVDLEGTRRFVSLEISDFDPEAVKKAIEGSPRPVLNVKIDSDLQYLDIYNGLKELGGEVLHLAIKRGGAKKEEETFSSKTVNVREIMAEMTKEYTEEERMFAFSLFDHLKDRKAEEAQNLVDAFFDSWRGKGPGHKSKSRAPQRSLEVF